MNIGTIQSVYFVDAGSIGMSTLVRYFLSKGRVMAGYNRTPSELVQRLIEEGVQVHYEENINLIPDTCKDPATTLVALTPAVPQEHAKLTYLRDNGFEIQKCAQVLGAITHSSKGLCVTDTHGKTTTLTMTAHLLHHSYTGYAAFLGGTFKNYGANLLLSPNSPYAVIGADESDRLFHWLSPYMSVIAATDPDHLDAYGTGQVYPESFEHYTTLIQPRRALTTHEGISFQPKVQEGVKIYTYSCDRGDFRAENIHIRSGEIFIDLIGPNIRIGNIQLEMPISINTESGVAAMALAYLSRATAEEIKQGMTSFRGVDRRFDFRIKNDQIVFPSDYAHRPSETKQSVMPMRELYRDKRIIAVFQPHFYIHTRDFYKDLADSLSLFDEVTLVDIYPAREQPIPGVASQLICDNLRLGIEKGICKKEEILDVLKTKHIEVSVTLGAGDIDSYVPDIRKLLTRRITSSNDQFANR